LCSLNAEPLSRIHHIHTLNLSYGTMLSRVEGLDVHLTLAAMSKEAFGFLLWSCF
jgi:hypothetical protein